MNKKQWFIATAVCAVVLFFAANPFGVMAWNSWFGLVQKADDATNYETRRKVEDTCRSMIASYQSDRLVYEQYNGGNEEQQSWADQAKMRANKTAVTYNEYILKNSYVWAGNIPNDIDYELEILNCKGNIQ